VHPILEAYLTKGGIFKTSIAKRWQKENAMKLKVVIDNDSAITEYHFYDAETDDLIKM
jgi:hypothetical protein